MRWNIDPIIAGPGHPVSWHVVFLALEAISAIYAAFKFYETRKFVVADWSWVGLAVAGHVIYSFAFVESHPTFEPFLEIRYYGLCFAIGLLLGARHLPIYFEDWGIPRKEGDALALWLPIGMILGAHYIHLIFYEQSGLTDLKFEIHSLVPLRWEVGRFWSIGSGLASHGGGLGAIVTLFIWSLLKKRSFWAYVDPAMCAAFWVVPWVRVGNFFNSEIVGDRWNGPWAIQFPRHDCAAPYTCTDAPFRHPSQIYEALIGFALVGLAAYLEKYWRKRLPSGAIFFIILGSYFLARVFEEFVKERQGVDDQTLFTMGQMLSAPIVLLCVFMLFFTKRFGIRNPLPADAVEPLPSAAPHPEAVAAPKRTGVAKKKKKKKV